MMKTAGGGAGIATVTAILLAAALLSALTPPASGNVYYTSWLATIVLGHNFTDYLQSPVAYRAGLAGDIAAALNVTLSDVVHVRGAFYHVKGLQAVIQFVNNHGAGHSPRNLAETLVAANYTQAGRYLREAIRGLDVGLGAIGARAVPQCESCSDTYQMRPPPFFECNCVRALDVHLRLGRAVPNATLASMTLGFRMAAVLKSRPNLLSFDYNPTNKSMIIHVFPPPGQHVVPPVHTSEIVKIMTKRTTNMQRVLGSFVVQMIALGSHLPMKYWAPPQYDYPCYVDCGPTPNVNTEPWLARVTLLRGYSAYKDNPAQTFAQLAADAEVLMTRLTPAQLQVAGVIPVEQDAMLVVLEVSYDEGQLWNPGNLTRQLASRLLSMSPILQNTTLFRFYDNSTAPDLLPTPACAACSDPRKELRPPPYFTCDCVAPLFLNITLSDTLSAAYHASGQLSVRFADAIGTDPSLVTIEYFSPTLAQVIVFPPPIATFAYDADIAPVVRLFRGANGPIPMQDVLSGPQALISASFGGKIVFEINAASPSPPTFDPHSNAPVVMDLMLASPYSSYSIDPQAFEASFISDLMSMAKRAIPNLVAVTTKVTGAAPTDTGMQVSLVISDVLGSTPGDVAAYLRDASTTYPPVLPSIIDRSFIPTLSAVPSCAACPPLQATRPPPTLHTCECVTPVTAQITLTSPRAYQHNDSLWLHERLAEALGVEPNLLVSVLDDKATTLTIQVFPPSPANALRGPDVAHLLDRLLLRLHGQHTPLELLLGSFRLETLYAGAELWYSAPALDSQRAGGSNMVLASSAGALLGTLGVCMAATACMMLCFALVIRCAMWRGGGAHMPNKLSYTPAPHTHKTQPHVEVVMHTKRVPISEICEVVSPTNHQVFPMTLVARPTPGMAVQQ